MKSTTDIKEAIGKIIIECDNLETDNKTDTEFHVDGKNCCLPSAVFRIVVRVIAMLILH